MERFDEKTYKDITQVVGMRLGIDMENATLIASYIGDTKIRRWLVLTPDREWVLFRDLTKANLNQFLSGGPATAVQIASAPFFLLGQDDDFNLILHRQVYHAVETAVKEHGIIDGDPYFTMTSVAPTQATMIRALMDKLGWEAADVVLEPLGTTSATKVYCDPDGMWRKEDA